MDAWIAGPRIALASASANRLHAVGAGLTAWTVPAFRVALPRTAGSGLRGTESSVAPISGDPVSVERRGPPDVTPRRAPRASSSPATR